LATSKRGQSPAQGDGLLSWSTKEGARTKKKKSCDFEAGSSKPVLTGRDVTEVSQSHTSCRIAKCGKSRCKTCKGDNFTSDVTGRKYKIISNILNCETGSVIYLISCKRCGIQYKVKLVRNTLSRLCELYIYQHFCSNRHSEEDMLVMTVRSTVHIEGEESTTLTSKCLQREDYWYREFTTIYPYGLNDNVKKVGNTSKNKDVRMVVWILFNEHMRKFRRRPNKKVKRKTDILTVESRLKELLVGYKSPEFCHAELVIYNHGCTINILVAIQYQ
jgi:hypothetical protein